jgi:hypothetical protein
MIRNSIFAWSCFLLCLIWAPAQVFAGNEDQAVGGRRAGLGFAYTGVGGDFWNVFHNPAGMAGIQQMEAGAFVERRFLLNQINMGTLGFAMPFKGERHVLGFTAGGYGFGGYAESKVALAYAAKVVDRLSLGAKVNYSLISIPTYGNKGSVFVDFGLVGKLTNQINVGFRIFNASQSYVSKELEEKIPTTLDGGIAFQASDKVLVVADVQKQVNFPISFRGGVEYAILDILKARIGASSQPVTFNAGIGLSLKNGLNIDFANSLQQQLGYTPSISASWRFGKSGEEK